MRKQSSRQKPPKHSPALPPDNDSVREEQFIPHEPSQEQSAPTNKPHKQNQRHAGREQNQRPEREQNQRPEREQQDSPKQIEQTKPAHIHRKPVPTHDVRAVVEMTTGLSGLGDVYHNLTVAQLYEHSIIMREGILSPGGALLIQDPASSIARENIIVAETGWHDKVRNRPMDATPEMLTERFMLLQSRVQGYFHERDVYVIDGFVGTDINARIAVQVITDSAWIANTMTQLIAGAPASKEEIKENNQPAWTIVIAGTMAVQAEKSQDRATTAPALALRALHCTERRAILTGAIGLADMKFILASIAEYAFAQRGASLMRGLVVTGKKNDSALLMGYGGSVRSIPFLDAERSLVGHDAYIWNNAGISAIDTSVIEAIAPDADDIHIGFGTIVQYPLDKSPEKLDKADARQPIMLGNRALLANPASSTRAHHPRMMIFLVPDVFGALPFVSRLTQEQALLFYTLGYGMKVQRDTHSKHKDKQVPASAVPAAPMILPSFTPNYHPSSVLRASVNVKILHERFSRNNAQYWLVNTGWVYGNAQNGKRIREEHITIALQTLLAGTANLNALQPDTLMGLQVLTDMNGIPEDLLMAHATWKDMRGYESTVKRLQSAFYKAIEPFKGDIDSKILSSIRGVIFETRDTAKDDQRENPRNDQRGRQDQHKRDQRAHAHQHKRNDEPSMSGEFEQPIEQEPNQSMPNMAMQNEFAVSSSMVERESPAHADTDENTPQGEPIPALKAKKMSVSAKKSAPKHARDKEINRSNNAPDEQGSASQGNVEPAKTPAKPTKASAKALEKQGTKKADAKVVRSKKKDNEPMNNAPTNNEA